MKIQSHVFAAAAVCGIVFFGVTVFADEDSQRQVVELRQEANKWVTEAKEAYRLDCQALEELWDAYCGADWEPNEEPDKDAARAQADKIQGRMKPLIDPLLSRYDGLKSRAEALKKDDTKDTAQRILEDMEKEQSKLAKLKEKGALRGSNHPLVQYAIEYGKQQHRRMESAYDCQVKDREFPSAGGRPDCVSASRCTVFEFKPNNDRAKRKGEQQLGRYVTAVEDYYESSIEKRQLPGSDYGGQEIITKLTARCMSGSSVELDARVETYAMCRKEFECVQ
jgi:Restriction endonuclease fold toxin 9